MKHPPVESAGWPVAALERFRSVWRPRSGSSTCWASQEARASGEMSTFFIAFLFFGGGCRAIPPGGINLAGVSNLHRVNGQLYRGAQLNAEGIANLPRMKIKTVINLHP